MDDVLRQVRVLRVPHQANGDDLGAVEEDPSHAQLLTTPALRGEGRQRTTVQATLHLDRRKTYRTAAQVPHAGVLQELPEHAGGRLFL